MSTNNQFSLPAGSFSSSGLTHRVLSHKTGQMLVLFSILEYSYFLILDFAENVRDIQTQLLLDTNETKIIAKKLGIKHPYDRKKKQLHRMSTDFLIQLQDRTIARTIKPFRQINKRVIEKFEIERIYWENRDVEWAIVTEEQLPQNLIMNLMMFREFYSISNQLSTKVFQEFIQLWDENLTLMQIIKAVGENLEISYGQCYTIVLNLLARNKLRFNHEHIFSEELTLKLANCHVNNHHQ